MRDPRGVLSLVGDWALRRLHSALPSDDFLRTDLARQWVTAGRLVDYEIADDQTIKSPRLPFVTFPDEWCDAQNFDAASLTLELQVEAVEAGFDLKDASAWNVLFDGAKPIFCDLLSFAPLQYKPWWAAGQFIRHFLLPLLLARDAGLHTSVAFRAWRDGVSPESARAMLGASRFLTRYWPLMVSAGSDRAHGGLDCTSISEVRQHRRSLHASLQWMLNGVRPVQHCSATTWSSYEEQRGHYSEASIDFKRSQVGEWLNSLRPGWVADFGCNAGEFSFIARRGGANVVALDADHGAVQRLYRRLAGNSGIYPVFAQLDDIGQGRGWAGVEVPGLAARLTGSVDVVMMLALVHHLAVSAAVRLSEIAHFAYNCTRQWVIVEWLDSSDPLLRGLCSERRRDPSEFSLQRQREAFVAAGFVVEATSPLPDSSRMLALLRKGSL